MSPSRASHTEMTDVNRCQANATPVLPPPIPNITFYDAPSLMQRYRTFVPDVPHTPPSPIFFGSTQSPFCVVFLNTGKVDITFEGLVSGSSRVAVQMSLFDSERIRADPNATVGSPRLALMLIAMVNPGRVFTTPPLSRRFPMSRRNQQPRLPI